MGSGLRTESVEIERELVECLPHWKWVELDSHGYAVVDVTPERLRVEWWFVPTVLERTTAESLGHSWMVERGRPRVVPARSQSDAQAANR